MDTRNEKCYNIHWLFPNVLLSGPQENLRARPDCTAQGICCCVCSAILHVYIYHIYKFKGRGKM